MKSICKAVLKSLERLDICTVLTYTFSPVVGVCFEKLGITWTVVASLRVGTRLHAVICWLTFIYIYKQMTCYIKVSTKGDLSWFSWLNNIPTLNCRKPKFDAYTCMRYRPSVTSRRLNIGQVFFSVLCIETNSRSVQVKGKGKLREANKCLYVIHLRCIWNLAWHMIMHILTPFSWIYRMK